MVFSLGASSLSCNLKKSNTDKSLLLEIQRPILFKSTLSHTTDRFSNNLFEKNNNSNLNNLFNFINNGHKNRHYWGNLISMSIFKIKIKTCQIKTSTRVVLDNLSIENSNDALSLIDFVVDSLKKLPIRNNSNNTVVNIIKSSQLKINVKSFNYYLLFRRELLLAFQLENLNLIKTSKVSSNMFHELFEWS